MTRQPPTKKSRYAMPGAAIRRSRKNSAIRTRQRYDVLAMLRTLKIRGIV